MAIKKPNEMDFSKKHFTMIVAGQPGLGKTTLALSAPKPLLFDLDDGISRVNVEHRKDTSSVTTYDEMLSDMNTDEYKQAESIVIDTGGSLVELMKDWAKKQDKRASKNGMAMFGVIKGEFNRLVSKIRRDNKNLIVVFHTTELTKNDVVTTRLACEGGAKDIIWTPADFGGYMMMLNGKRTINFTPTEEYFAKGCYGIQGTYDIPQLTNGSQNNFLTNLFRKASKILQEESKVFEVQKLEYESIMEQGKTLIGGIVDDETSKEIAKQLGSLPRILTSYNELIALYKIRVKEVKENAKNNAEPVE